MTQMQSDVIYTNRSNSESETITDLSDDSDDNLTESTLSTEETMMFDSNEMAEPESDSTLSSDENAHQHSLAQFTISFFDNNDICEETAETIVDTLDAPLDNGTDTFVCTLCSKVFRGKVAYDRHICKGNIPDNPLEFKYTNISSSTKHFSFFLAKVIIQSNLVNGLPKHSNRVVEPNTNHPNDDVQKPRTASTAERE